MSSVGWTDWEIKISWALVLVEEKRGRGMVKMISAYNIWFPPQGAIQPLRDGADLRDGVQSTLADFKEQCGLSPIANVKQCIRLLGTRVANSAEQASLQFYMNGDVSTSQLHYNAITLSP